MSPKSTPAALLACIRDRHVPVLVEIHTGTLHLGHGAPKRWRQVVAQHADQLIEHQLAETVNPWWGLWREGTA